MGYTDYFGFLNKPWKFEFEGGGVYPIDNYEANLNEIEKIKNRDGFIYPYEVSNISFSSDNKAKPIEIPNTKKPASLYKLWNSHIIKLKSYESSEILRNYDAAFIMYFLGILFNTRLQFTDWWFEGKIPISDHQYFYAGPKEAEECLDYAYRFWKNLNGEYKKLLINVLFMHIKTRSYEWDWEKFTFEYMVFDGLYKIIKRTHPEVNKMNKDNERLGRKLKLVCDYFSISYKKETLTKIGALRNNLFHEALWDTGLPIVAGSTFSFYAPEHLHKLNQRIITCLVGYNNKFSRSGWEGIVTYLFDPLEK